MKNRGLILGIGLVVVAAIVVAAILLATGGDDDKSKGDKAAGTQEAAALFDGIDQDGIELGHPNAPITMVEFADLQCPFCAQYTKNVLPTLVRRYVRTGKVKMQLRLLNFIGPDSEKANKLAAAAGLQDKTWQFADVFYANQGEENTGYVTDEFLEKIANGTPGLNAKQAIAEADGGSAAARQVAADQAAGKARSIQSTPSFYVGRGDSLAPLQVSALEPGAFTAPLDQLLSSR